MEMKNKKLIEERYFTAHIEIHMTYILTQEHIIHNE